MDETSSAAGNSGREDDRHEDPVDELQDGVVDEELEEHDLPPLPEADPADGPAPAA
jgi:hypothetical protein